MNSSMPQSGAAPSSPNAMPGGLGAILQQPNQAPKGASAGDMAEMMAMAKELPDSELADVLNGRSIRIPQSLAMIVAMGRKQLRTAMQGAQAQQQAQQPSVKDRFLAEEAQMAAAPQAGLDQIPAPNMDTVDMAGGGIVAFQDNENQPVRTGMPGTDLTEEEKKQLAENPYMRRVQAITNPGKAISDYFASRPSSEELFNRASKARTGEIPAFVGTEPTVKGKLVDAGLVSRDTPIKDVAKVAAANEQKRTALNAVDREEAAAGMAAILNAQQNQAAPKDADKRSNDRRAALADTSPGTGIIPKERTNPFGQLSAALPDYEKVKSQGLGEAMMVMSGALFGNPDISRAMAQGLPTLAKISGATRKEVKDLKKDYDAQQVSLAKANELFESGQEDLAFKKLKQSQDHAYQMQMAMANMAQAGKPAADVQLLQALKMPGESPSDTYARMKQMGQDPKSDQALRDAYAKSYTLQTMYPTVEAYIRKMTPGGATIAGNTGFSAVYGPDNKRIQ